MFTRGHWKAVGFTFSQLAKVSANAMFEAPETRKSKGRRDWHPDGLSTALFKLDL